MIENLAEAEGYCHQKGIFPAREAVVMQQQARGVTGVTAEEVFIGNGVSELIDLVLRALLNDGDEVLVPSPDYPLWTAAVTLNGGRRCTTRAGPRTASCPIRRRSRALVTPRTRAIVVINPNNPDRRGLSARGARGARAPRRAHGLVVFSDEIYDQMTYDGAEFVPMATLVHDTLCATLSGLSKVYRACGYRVGWAVFSGRTRAAAEYLAALELLARCACAATCRRSGRCRPRSAATRASSELDRPGRPAVRVARGDPRRRRSAAASCTLAPPGGAMYAFVGVDTRGAAGLRRPAVRARPARAEARAGRARA